MINWDSITKMPYWLARPLTELDKLRKGAVRFWQRYVNLLQFVNNQLDPMTAELEFVHLLAWEREIAPIPTETEHIYRTRVKFALQFAKGAGSKAGWLSMFEKLGMPWITIGERFNATEWDVIDLRISDQEAATNQALLNSICRQYGRTTRRYMYSTTVVVPAKIAVSTFDNHSNFTVAKVPNLMPAKRFLTMGSESSYHVAKITQET